MLLCITCVCTQVPCDKRGPGVQAGGFQEASRRAHRTAWQVAGPESHGSAQGGECNHRAADPIQGVPGFPGKATAKLRLKAERDLGGICCWRRCVCSRLGSSQYRGWGREEESLLEKLRVRSPLRSFLYPTTCLTQPKACVLGAGGAHSCPGLTWNG